jgi:hypothetical protein
VGVDLALDGERRQLLEAAVGAVDRQVPHLARRLAGHAELDQLVVAPAGSVDEQASAVIQLGAHRCRELLHARQVHQCPAAALVGQAVTYDSSAPFAGAETRPFRRGHIEGPVRQPISQRYVGLRDDRLPLDRAVGIEHAKQRRPVGERVVHRLGGVELEATSFSEQ